MNAVTLLEPLLQWWERFSQANPGIGFMAFVYGAVLVIVWMFSRLRPTRPWRDVVSIIIIHRELPPQPPPIIGRRPEPFEDDDSDSFAE